MKRLAWSAALAGAATLFHCGGTSDVIVAGDDGGPDGTSAEAGGGADGGGGKDATGGGHDGSSGGADSSSGAGEGGGGHEAGAEGGGHEGGLEAGGADGAPGDAGGGDGGGDGGGADAAQDSGGGSDAGGDGGGNDGGGNDGGGKDAGGGDGGSDGGAGDAGPDSGPADAGDGGITGQALFRVGAVMPFPTAIDFCWQQAGGSWNGPVMLGWGVSTRLAYQEVSDYVSVPLAATTVRIVASTAANCNTSLGEGTFTPASANDAFFVAGFAQGTIGAQVKAFDDERTTTAATNTKLRAIHAAITSFTGGGPIGQPVDLYVGAGTTTSLFDNVSFASTAAQGNGVDANGYLSHDVFNNADMRVRLHGNGGADLLDAPAFTTTAGHVYSLFTVGVHNLAATNTTPMRLLVCDDTAPVVGHVFACTAVGTQL